MALTVMASMSVLIAQAFRMAHESADGGAHLERAVHVQRVLRLMGDQWLDRRAVPMEGAESDGKAAPETGPALLADRVRFITATAVLEPRWPLVEATWLIEQADVDAGAAPEWNLVYQELAITSFRADRPSRPQVRRLVALSNCSKLTFEQFAAVSAPEARAQAQVMQQLDWVGFEIEPDAQDEAPEPPIAVRLVGTYQGEEFACVFAVQALR